MAEALTYTQIEKATARGLCPRCGKILIASTSGSVCSDFNCCLGLLPKLQEGARKIESREIGKRTKEKQLGRLTRAEFIAGDIYQVGERIMKLLRFGSPARMRKIMEKTVAQEVKAAADRGLGLAEIMKIHDRYIVAAGEVAIGKRVPKIVFSAMLLIEKS